MKTATVEYLGNLRTEGKHLKSGNTIITDAPIDNMGKGEAFSPTDLFSTSLATCMLTIMGIAANKHNIEMGFPIASVTKIMADNPRRIQKILVEMDFRNQTFNQKEFRILKIAAETCPVALSIHPDTHQELEFKNYSII